MVVWSLLTDYSRKLLEQKYCICVLLMTLLYLHKKRKKSVSHSYGMDQSRFYIFMSLSVWEMVLAISNFHVISMLTVSTRLFNTAVVCSSLICPNMDRWIIIYITESVGNLIFGSSAYLMGLYYIYSILYAFCISSWFNFLVTFKCLRRIRKTEVIFYINADASFLKSNQRHIAKRYQWSGRSLTFECHMILFKEKD